MRPRDGCDISPDVLGNPHLTAASLIRDNVLPYPDASFDMVVSSYVWEHLDEPAGAVAEMIRVLKPGGRICAITTNGWGYVALAARAIPKALHRAVLRSAHRLLPARLQTTMCVFFRKAG